MDTRKRILVVEDDEQLRESYVANLERAGYMVGAAGNLPAAEEAIRDRTFHIAVIDIMLGGRDDMANRDGVRVLELLLNLGEATRWIVLSAQPEQQRVRDFLKDYDAFDYISKKEAREGGFPLLLQTITRALDNHPLDAPLEWGALEGSLSIGYTGPDFAFSLLQHLDFKGGFQNLSGLLLNACRHLMPLLASQSETESLRFDAKLPGIRGRYWSKGQGVAVEILLLGRDAGLGKGEHPMVIGDRSVLYERMKGDLTIFVVECPNVQRNQFISARSR